MTPYLFGKIRSVIRRFGPVVDFRAALEFGKRNAPINNAAFVKQFVHLAVEKDSPIPRRGLPFLHRNIRRANVRGAVVGNGIIKLGLVV